MMSPTFENLLKLVSQRQENLNLWKDDVRRRVRDTRNHWTPARISLELDREFSPHSRIRIIDGGPQSGKTEFVRRRIETLVTKEDEEFPPFVVSFDQLMSLLDDRIRAGLATPPGIGQPQDALRFFLDQSFSHRLGQPWVAFARDQAESILKGQGGSESRVRHDATLFFVQTNAIPPPLQPQALVWLYDLNQALPRNTCIELDGNLPGLGDLLHTERHTLCPLSDAAIQQFLEERQASGLWSQPERAAGLPTLRHKMRCPLLLDRATRWWAWRTDTNASNADRYALLNRIARWENHSRDWLWDSEKPDSVVLNHRPSGKGGKMPPKPKQEIIGRDPEILQLRHRLFPGALEIVQGPGGLGKTALTRETIKELFDDEGRARPGMTPFDRALYLNTYDCCRNREKHDYLEACQNELAVLAGYQHGQFSDFRQHLAECAVLVILEGAEQLEDAALAELVEAIQSPSAVIVNTRSSRQAAYITSNADQIIAVKKLETDDAMRLLLRVSEDFDQLRPKEQAILKRMLGVVSGHPLNLLALGHWRNSGPSDKDMEKLADDLELDPVGTLDDIEGELYDRITKRYLKNLTDEQREVLGACWLWPPGVFEADVIGALLGGKQQEREVLKTINVLAGAPGLLRQRADRRYEWEHAFGAQQARSVAQGLNLQPDLNSFLTWWQEREAEGAGSALDPSSASGQDAKLLRVLVLAENMLSLQSQTGGSPDFYRDLAHIVFDALATVGDNPFDTDAEAGLRAGKVLLRLVEAANLPDEPQTWHFRSEAHHWIGNGLEARSEISEALKEFEAALEFNRELHKNAPDNPGYCRDCSVGCGRIASLLSGTEDKRKKDFLEERITFSQDACDFAQKSDREGKTTNHIPLDKLYDELASALNDIGQWFAFDSQPSQADKAQEAWKRAREGAGWGLKLDGKFSEALRTSIGISFMLEGQFLHSEAVRLAAQLSADEKVSDEPDPTVTGMNHQNSPTDQEPLVSTQSDSLPMNPNVEALFLASANAFTESADFLRNWDRINALHNRAFALHELHDFGAEREVLEQIIDALRALTPEEKSSPPESFGSILYNLLGLGSAHEGLSEAFQLLLRHEKKQIDTETQLDGWALGTAWSIIGSIWEDASLHDEAAEFLRHAVDLFEVASETLPADNMGKFETKHDAIAAADAAFRWHEEIKTTNGTTPAPLPQFLQDYRAGMADLNDERSIYSMENDGIIRALVRSHLLTGFADWRFVELLRGSITLTVLMKTRVVDAVPTLSQYQLDELVNTFEDETRKIDKLRPKEGAPIQWMERMAASQWREVKRIYMERIS
jgi:hypothetical protein